MPTLLTSITQALTATLHTLRMRGSIQNVAARSVIHEILLRCDLQGQDSILQIILQIIGTNNLLFNHFLLMGHIVAISYFAGLETMMGQLKRRGEVLKAIFETLIIGALIAIGIPFF